MSSMVSVRSYGRQKSADARLQRSRSQSASLALEADLAASQAAERQHRAELGIPEVHVRTPRRRVKSALETRKEQEASDIFHRREKTKAPADPSWGKTKYSEDFGPKTPVSQAPMRPVSATRRNNPHPSQAFMTWQYPVRIHKHQRAVHPHPDTWRFINEGFYDDYADNYNTGDAKNEVPITNVATIEFPGSKKKSPTGDTSHPLRGVSGRKAHLLPRHGESNTESRKNLRPASPQTRMIWGTVKDGTFPVVKEWLKVASSKERELVLQMLQAGYDHSEDVRMRKALSDVLQPSSAEKVQEWLQNSSEPERQILLHVLETLAIAADEKERSPDMNSNHYALGFNQDFPMNGHGNHYRAYSYPITLRPRRSAHHGSQGRSYKGQYSKYNHRSSSKHKKDADSSKASGVFDGRSLGLRGKKMTIQSSRDDKGASKVFQSSSKDLKPEIWHNRILKKHTGANSFHAGGIFNLPQKDAGQHYSIHPEWPTA